MLLAITAARPKLTTIASIIALSPLEDIYNKLVKPEMIRAQDLHEVRSAAVENFAPSKGSPTIYNTITILTISSQCISADIVDILLLTENYKTITINIVY